MKKTFSIVVTFASVLLVSLAILSRPAIAEEIVWKTNPTPLLTPINQVESIVHSGKLYVIGGMDEYGNRLSDVYFAEINPDGSVDSWVSTASLPDGRDGHRSVVWEDYVYTFGGARPGGGHIETATVWYSVINADGTLGAWTSTTGLPYTVSQPLAVAWNGRIYFGGGWTGFSWKREIYYAEINPDGSIDSWIPTTDLPEPRRWTTSVAHSDRIYVIGGVSGGGYHDTVYYATINPDGSVGTWSTTESLPNPRAYASAEVVDGQIYYCGGSDGTTFFDEVIHATINADGSISSWFPTTPLPEPRWMHASVVSEDRIYVIGGNDGPTKRDTIYYSSPPTVPATVDIKPNTLNLRSRGKWITCYIELPEGYDVNDINVSTILLNDTIPPKMHRCRHGYKHPAGIGDYDSDSIPDLMVKFDRASVISYIVANVNITKLFEERFMTITLTITGYLNDDTMFQGSDTIKIIYTPRGIGRRHLFAR
jgi:hypothetical protein